MIEEIGLLITVIGLLYIAFIGQKTLQEWWNDRGRAKKPSNEDKSNNLVYQNLPQRNYAQLIGRSEQVNKIMELLKIHPDSRFHIVSIDGLGGIGKSALALEVAYRFLEETKQINMVDSEKFNAIIWIFAKHNILTSEGIIKRPNHFNVLDDIFTSIAVTLEHEEITRAKPKEQVEVSCGCL